MDFLIVVDVQNDFCTGGALEVPNGDAIVPKVNKLAREFEAVAFTQDWHPGNHVSFASNWDGKDPFQVIDADYGEQILWPNHCMQGTEGAEFHPDLDTRQADTIIRKGYDPEIDSYSAFFENDGETPTGLRGYLIDHGARADSRIYVCGLATDFCVKWTVEDALDLGFNVTLVEDATKGLESEAATIANFRQGHVSVETTAEVLS